MNFINDISQNFARHNISKIVAKANKLLDADLQVKSIKCRSLSPEEFMNADSTEEVKCTATITCDRGQFDFSWIYYTDGGQVYTWDSDEDLVDNVKEAYDSCPSTTRSVKSATAIRAASARIVAADEDDEGEEGSAFDTDFADIDVDGDDLNDTLDDVADTVQDIQDSVDEIQEDDVNIEIDNNISNHYIAECEGCHGIFISATVQSDQKISHVTGICPLCQKETDQKMKWVIRDVESAEV